MLALQKNDRLDDVKKIGVNPYAIHIWIEEADFLEPQQEIAAKTPIGGTTYLLDWKRKTVKTPRNSIDQATLAHLLAAGAVRGTYIGGYPGGWYVVFKYGETESVLSSRESAIRVFRKFETLVSFLKKRGVVQYQVDAGQHDSVPIDSKRSNTYASERMRRIHQAASNVKVT